MGSQDDPSHPTGVDFRELVEHSPAPCFESDANGDCTFVNRAWTELSGLGFEVSLGLGWTSAVVEEDRARILAERPDQIAAGLPYEQRYRICCSADGGIHRMLVQTFPISSAGELRGWLGWLTDETYTHELLADVAEREAMLRAVFEQSAAGMVVLDADMCIIRVNSRFCDWLGYTESELLGRHGLELMAPGEEATTVRRFGAVQHGENLEPMKRVVIAKDGRKLPVWSVGGPIVIDEDRPPMMLAIVTEFAAQHEHEQQLEHLARHDPLTGLPNRRALEEWSERSAAAAAVLVDLNGFKALNDEHGHQAGDDALVQVAERLRRCVRHTDLLCRFGGDEFLILLADAPPGSTQALVDRIAHSFDQPFVVDGREVHLSAAVGVAQGASSAADLAMAADDDLYRNKRGDDRGQGTIHPT